MKNRSFCSPVEQLLVIDSRVLCVLLFIVLFTLAAPRRAEAGDAPPWMHAVASAPLPPHDEKTDAVVLYSEKIVTVQ